MVELAGAPLGPVAVPAAVRDVAGGRSIEPIWVNQLGGITFRIAGGTHYVKWLPVSAGQPLLLGREMNRLQWAGQFTPVPEVRGHGEDDDGLWLMTAGLPGESAVSARWLAEPAVAVAALGTGLRAMHDAMPVGDCPFDWSVRRRVAAARQRAKAGLIDPHDWKDSHGGLTVDEALERIADAPEVDQFVVCHGDACAPNTLIGDDGQWTAHVDLDTLGVADRWADLAIATWSTQWNYGPGWESALLDAYGVEADPERIAYYRLLWDLT